MFDSMINALKQAHTDIKGDQYNAKLVKDINSKQVDELKSEFARQKEVLEDRYSDSKQKINELELQIQRLQGEVKIQEIKKEKFQ